MWGVMGGITPTELLNTPQAPHPPLRGPPSNQGMIAPGNHGNFRFAARSTTPEGEGLYIGKRSNAVEYIFTLQH